MQKHLAVFKKGVGEQILDGTKIIETRFSQIKLPPYGVISAGDLVYIKPSGKDIIGEFRVKKVIFMDALNEEDLKDIRQRWGDQIAADEAYWKKKETATYASLIFIAQTTPFITSPVKFSKKDLRGWVVLD